MNTWTMEMKRWNEEKELRKYGSSSRSVKHAFMLDTIYIYSIFGKWVVGSDFSSLA